MPKVQSKAFLFNGHSPTIFRCEHGCITEFKKLLRVPLTRKTKEVELRCPHCNSDKLTKIRI